VSPKIALIVGYYVATAPQSGDHVLRTEISTQPMAETTVNIAVYGAEPDKLPNGGGLVGSWRIVSL
jgi:hypothetical protein